MKCHPASLRSCCIYALWVTGKAKATRCRARALLGGGYDKATRRLRGDYTGPRLCVEARPPDPYRGHREIEGRREMSAEGWTREVRRHRLVALMR